LWIGDGIMEILSTGEKIKRARVYKGCTLKELCDDKISVSKMSCIENDKVTPEDWVLQFIADRLELDIDYLTQGVSEQIRKNISKLEHEKNIKDYEEKVQYNLDYALEYKYFDLAFTLMHLLFCYYLDRAKIENVQVLTTKYYDLCGKSGIDENQLVYYKDMARYFYVNEEFVQAAAYYNNVRKVLRETKSKNKEMLATVTYNEAACYVMLENYERAYEIAIRLIDLIEYAGSDIKKAEMYHMLALLSLKMNKGNFEEYEKDSYQYYKEDSSKKAQAIYNYAVSMFEVGLNEKAVDYIKQGLRVYSQEDKEEYVKYMLLCIKLLINKDVLDVAQSICDEALNSAIGLDSVKLIEKAYYYKAMILQKQNSYSEAEMYMNLSMDALFKFGNRQDRYKRYMEMGNMYHKLGQTNDALKYFTLAMALERKM
jgi:tetratricopeptide (TPR) repeat protein